MIKGLGFAPRCPVAWFALNILTANIAIFFEKTAFLLE